MSSYLDCHATHHGINDCCLIVTIVVNSSYVVYNNSAFAVAENSSVINVIDIHCISTQYSYIFHLDPHVSRVRVVSLQFFEARASQGSSAIQVMILRHRLRPFLRPLISQITSIRYKSVPLILISSNRSQMYRLSDRLQRYSSPDKGLNELV
jgi:hypothetical protein